MLQIMRSHKFFTVVVLGAITIMITIAFVFYGIGPQTNPSQVAIAHVNDERIPFAEYERAYEITYRRAREIYKDEEEIKKLNLKTRVLEELIDNIVLTKAAENAGITVTRDELMEAIINDPAFHMDGVFNEEVYTRRLKLNRITPAIFESAVEKDLLLNKMRRMIIETADLTEEEKKILEMIEGENKDQLLGIFLSAKRELAVKAYVEGLKRQMKITVNSELIY